MKKKIAIVGVGGRTGTLFTQELMSEASVVGIGRESLVNKLNKDDIYVVRGENNAIKLNCHAISDIDFDDKVKPDFIFITTKNPVAPVIRYYYERVDPNYIPDLILSQNGFLAADEAFEELENIFGGLAKKIRIIRIALFNAVSITNTATKIFISYYLPIRLAFGVAYGPDYIEDLKGVFDRAKIEAYPVLQNEVKDMEFSKLFTNLIGVASYAYGMSVENGFKDKKAFSDEILVLKEFIRVVQKSNRGFLNFRHYPIRTFAYIIEKTPIHFLRPFRKLIAKIITKERGGKSKGNIDEIDYYNGAVVKLGNVLGVAIPVNKKIYEIIKGGL